MGPHREKEIRVTVCSTNRITVKDIGDVEVSVSDRGSGHPVLLLHGGGGPFTVTPWADQFAKAEPVHVLTPVHPGFLGTPRPDALRSAGGLAALYVDLLAALDLRGVTVIGNSIGGWIAAEMAVLGSDRVSSYVLLDAVGIEVAGHPIADFFSLTPAEVAQRTFYDPATFGVDPAKLSPEAREAMASVSTALGIYAGNGMTDATLLPRLGAVRAPVLVVWGEADGIGDPDLGRAYAAAIPAAQFRLLDHAGHMPQIEMPGALIDLIWPFISAHVSGNPTLSKGKGDRPDGSRPGNRRPARSRVPAPRRGQRS
jgi:pimeloyl-ACP methyl ester carboxylesterase